MNHLELPTFSPNGLLQGVIEIPAGTNHKYEYNKSLQQFQQDVRDGRPRMVRFLPYPVNYGFVPSTRMDKNRDGDGDPLDVLLLAESLPTGSVLEIEPIGLLKLKDLGELDHKVLAIPADPNLRIIDATDWDSFQKNYSAIRHILELFFLYYDGLGVMTLMGWGDDQEAREEIEKWRF
ncbi:MAG: inorganic diphosphatase [Bacteroidetes bacterium]|nr:inorganic diphosphatase [Bacteroidota bacterium]